MGPQQVLRAAAVVVLTAGATAVASAAPVLTDRVAVIDLGPADRRATLSSALVKQGLEVLTGDGVETALSGIAPDRDVLALAAAMADAQSRYGSLACTDAITTAHSAIALAAARQAAGLPVPELARAWTYILTCAEHLGAPTTAHVAATHLRTLGGPDVNANLLARHPEVDALSNREAIELEIKTEVAGADVWVDFRRVGTSPLKLVLSAGTHVIAAASGSRRGALTGTVVRKQPVVTVPMPDQSGTWAPLAAKIASWGGKLPGPRDLEAVMNEVGSRVALVRYGDTVELWGHVGRGEPVRRLGDGDDGVRRLQEVDALAALAADRIATWNDRAPDPDQPLLVESPEERKQRGTGAGKKDDEEEPTKWWVYATIAGAVLAGGIVIYSQESASNTQRVELKYP